MFDKDHPILNHYLLLYAGLPVVKSLQEQLTGQLNSVSQSDVDYASIYQQLIPVIEDQMWQSDMDEGKLALYQQFFQEMERHISDDSRHEIVIVIPVADRPQHLRDCLNSLLMLCRTFGYGGFEYGFYKKISVLIADDSRQQACIEKNREIAEYFNAQGIHVIYFGQADQLHLLDDLSEDTRNDLRLVIGMIDSSTFYHKGASITRNICYLKLKQLYGLKKKVIFFFVDSDQEFKVNVNTCSGEKEFYAINYFYHLDQVFGKTKTQVLTGKVVGDPPVSPSVMIGRFLDDVIHFLSQMSKLGPELECRFHQASNASADDASYHDMADLFGFKSKTDSYNYHCAIKGSHDHFDCLNEFADKLNHFFDGEHPTRKTYYQYESVISSMKNARTVYTGNYVMNHDALDYFIPFASLKLRMAGPVLGRIMQSELGENFISAHLPMLHKRTVEDLGQSEFRSGVNRSLTGIDLHDEFERQYFGDVMLFTMERLTEADYPSVSMSENEIAAVLAGIEEDIQQKYMHKHEQIKLKLTRLKQMFNDDQSWWNRVADNQKLLDRFQSFIHNVHYNFGDDSTAYQLITSKEHRQQRCASIVRAIKAYPEDRLNWHKALNEINNR